MGKFTDKEFGPASEMPLPPANPPGSPVEPSQWEQDTRAITISDEAARRKHESQEAWTNILGTVGAVAVPQVGMARLARWMPELAPTFLKGYAGAREAQAAAAAAGKPVGTALTRPVLATRDALAEMMTPGGATHVAVRGALTGAGNAAGQALGDVLGGEVPGAQRTFARVGFGMGADIAASLVEPALGPIGEGAILGVRGAANIMSKAPTRALTNEDRAVFRELQDVAPPGATPTPAQFRTSGVGKSMEQVASVGMFGGPILARNRERMQEAARARLEGLIESYNAKAPIGTDTETFLRDMGMARTQAIRGFEDKLYAGVRQHLGASAMDPKLVDVSGLANDAKKLLDRTLGGRVSRASNPTLDRLARMGEFPESEVAQKRALWEKDLQTYLVAMRQKHPNFKFSNKQLAQQVVKRAQFRRAEELAKKDESFARGSLSFEDARALRSELEGLKRNAETGENLTGEQRRAIEQLTAQLDNQVEKGVRGVAGDPGVDAWRAANEQFRTNATEVFNTAFDDALLAKGTPRQIAEAFLYRTKVGGMADPVQVSRVVNHVGANTDAHMATIGHFLTKEAEKVRLHPEAGRTTTGQLEAVPAALDGKAFAKHLAEWSGPNDAGMKALIPDEAKRNTLWMTVRGLEHSQRDPSKHFPGSIAIQLASAGALGTLVGLKAGGVASGGTMAAILLGPMAFAKMVTNPRLAAAFTLGARSPVGSDTALRAWAQWKAAAMDDGLLTTPDLLVTDPKVAEDLRHREVTLQDLQRSRALGKTQP